MKLHLRTLALAAFASCTLAAQGGTIDFSTVQGSHGNPLVLPEATLTNLTGTQLLVGIGCASQADGFCFLGTGAAADGRIDFSSLVADLSFDIDGWQQGDFVAITAFNGTNSLGTLNAVSNGRLDFSAFGSITSLHFDDNSTSNGVGYSTFFFNAANNNQVPEPGGLALTSLALLGAMGAGRRANKR